METNLNPDQILAQAEATARDAAAAAASLDRECDELEAALKQKRATAQKLREVAERFGVSTPSLAVVVMPSIATVTEGATASAAVTGERQSRSVTTGSAEPDIQAVLRSSGPLGPSELQRLITERFGRRWSMTTIFHQLKKGKESGKYQNEAGKWLMPEEELA
ncbi:MAG: hypothetical protein HY854_14310 [Burkholderiales bacterium]|nr:hypothetical protein [Burkholderiales bacterium]